MFLAWDAKYCWLGGWQHFQQVNTAVFQLASGYGTGVQLQRCQLSVSCYAIPSKDVSSELLMWASVDRFTGMSLAAVNSQCSNAATAAERKPARSFHLLHCGIMYSAHVAHCNPCLASADASCSHCAGTCSSNTHTLYVHVPGRQCGKTTW